MRKKLKVENSNNLKEVYGITDVETVKLDFDNVRFKDVKYWAFRTLKWFRLKGFIILRSSKNCYHVVFDRRVSWRNNVKIMAWVCLLSGCKGLNKWFLMQCIKGASTLRVSPKMGNPDFKPSPRVVYCYGSQSNQVKEFLVYRKLIKNIIVKLNRNVHELNELNGLNSEIVEQGNVQFFPLKSTLKSHVKLKV